MTLDAGGLDRLLKDSFDAGDHEAGTSGGCAEFALILMAALDKAGYEAAVLLCCLSDGRENPIRCSDGSPMCWTHAVVSFDNALFDVRGKVTEESLCRDFCCDMLAEVDAEVAVSKAAQAPAMEVLNDRRRKTWRAVLSREIPFRNGTSFKP